jgi:hypothetical protein
MPRQTFCGQCYHRLPKPHRNSLYNGLGEGYEQAVDRALKALNANFIPDVRMVEQIDKETGEVTLARDPERGPQRPVSPSIPRSYQKPPHQRVRSFGVPQDDKLPDGRRPWQQALADGEAFRELFPPACYERWEIAGSVRRRSPGGAKDVEHVVIPRFGDVPDGDSLFAATVRVNLLWYQLDAMVKADRVSKHLYTSHGKDGVDRVAPRWGEIHRGADFRDFNHDIFAADADNFGSVLAIRTGPGEYSKMLVLKLQYNGYVNREGHVWDKTKMSCSLCGWTGRFDGEGGLIFIAPEDWPTSDTPKFINGRDRAGVCPGCRKQDGLSMARVPAPDEETYFRLCNVRLVDPAARRV